MDQNILYSECPCGSGKKFKFCCYPVIRDELSRDPSRSEVTQAIRRRSQKDRLSAKSGDLLIVDLDDYHSHIREGLRQMHGGNFKEAKRELLKAKQICDIVPTAYNNLALCALVQGDLEEAEAWTGEVVRRFPLENPFGLAMHADIRYLKGDVVGALDIIERAEKIAPPSVDQAARLCESMAHFMDHKRIARYAETCGFSDDPDIAFFRGIALANLGKPVAAARALQIALRGHLPSYVRRILDDLSAARRPPTICGDWMYFTHDTFTLFAGIVKGVRAGGEQQWSLSGEVMAEFIEVETNGGLFDLPTAIKIVSEMTVSKRSERMLNALRNDASRPENIRTAADEAYRKLFTENDAGKRLRKIPVGGVQRMVITEEAATHAPIDPDCEQDYSMAVNICLDPKHTNKDVRRALQLLEKLHERMPDNPAVVNNYASALAMNGHLGESIDVVRECFAKHPEYVFGASNYLKLLILGDRIEEARAMHDNYRLPLRIHPDAYMAWCRVEMMFFGKIGDRERLANVAKGMEMVQEQFKRRFKV